MKKDQYAVIGNPIKHSLSPRIHTLFASNTNQVMEYTARLVSVQQLETALTKLQKEGFKGVSITAPLKVKAYNCVDYYSDRAYLVECINTIRFDEDGRRFGDNTDGEGLLQDFQKNLHIHLKDKTILIFGAGGAVRNCLWSLQNAGVKTITIANRTLENAEMLCDMMDTDNMQACALTDMPEHSFDIIINGTNAHLESEALPLTAALFTKDTVYYDFAYGDHAKPALDQARALGMQHVHDGLGMLVEQAALQFQLWRGVLPDTAIVLSALRS